MFTNAGVQMNLQLQMQNQLQIQIQLQMQIQSEMLTNSGMQFHKCLHIVAFTNTCKFAQTIQLLRNSFDVCLRQS